MKASEVIAQLRALQEQHGDLYVSVCMGEAMVEVEYIKYSHAEPRPRSEPPVPAVSDGFEGWDVLVIGVECD